ncbi:MAG: type II toxin-antitoxin system tRNA(fMet)-specific endonuclease VapC [Candidatus Anammoxibacter sp.]
MKYMLDTNICVYIINNKPEKVLRKLQKYPISEFCISSISHSELQYGISHSKNSDKNRLALDEFLLPLNIIPYDSRKTAQSYANIRALLESKGKTIDPLDMLIAAHAISLNLIIITNNIFEFSRVPKLKCENWVG